MMHRSGLWVTLFFWLTAGWAMAQTQPWRGSEPPSGTPHTQPGIVPVQPKPGVVQAPVYRSVPSAAPGQRPGGPAQPDQPVAPKYPTLERRPAAPPVAPFRLTPQQEADLDRVLKAWEQNSARVNTFGCAFTRFEYDPVFGPADQPAFIDQGQIKYAAPDKGMFKIDGERPEHWISDGKSIFEYNYKKKQLIERQLPPSLQGQAITDGPLPFIFGAKADKLKERYFMRLITPEQAQKEQIWLEAYPRFQQDAANFQRAELILTVRDMTPFALQIFLPNGKSRTVYRFDNILVNDPLRIIKFDPFRAAKPFGWQSIVEEPPPTQAAQPSGTPQIGARPPGVGRRQ